MLLPKGKKFERFVELEEHATVGDGIRGTARDLKRATP
jgi:hypothetical protein